MLVSATDQIEQLNRRYDALKSERSSYEATWYATAQLVAPRSARFMLSEARRGEYRHKDILNESGLFARRILSAGLLSGMTSPSRPWFELGFDDKELADYHAHKLWLSTVRDRMLTVFRVSNTYSALFAIYNQLGPFSTACAVVDEHYDNVIHITPLAIGQYSLFTDEYGFVVGMAREARWTCEQIVRRFVRKSGWDAVTPQVKAAWDRSRYDDLFDIRHMIRPRPEADPKQIDAQRHPVQSIYWQPERAGLGSRPLDDAGYAETPLVAPRWEVVSNDVYGTGCGEEALGSIRQLQHMERVMGVALEQMVRPPMLVPASLKRGGRAEFAPGSQTVVESDEMGRQVRPVYEREPRLAEFNGERQVVAERVYTAFYADVITAISQLRRQGRGADPTATEIQEIVGEKLMMLGPALERMQVELIEPLIDRTFAAMDRAGLLPPAPEAIRGRALKVNHISLLAQAQRAVATRTIERGWTFATAVASVDQSVLDVVNRDEMLRHYLESQGSPPQMMRSRDDVAADRAQRAQQAVQEREAMMLAEGAKAARDAATVPTQGGTSNLVADIAGL